MTTSDIQKMEVPDELRKLFEDKVFNARFIASIAHTGLGGPVESMSKDCPYKHELCARDEKGDYKDEQVSAMWFGFKLALSCNAPPDKRQAAADATKEAHNIDELLGALEALKAKHGGDVPVTVWQYAGGEDELCDVAPRFDAQERTVVLDTTYRR